MEEQVFVMIGLEVLLILSKHGSGEEYFTKEEKVNCDGHKKA